MLEAAAPRKVCLANTSSVAGLVGYPGNIAYATSKFAVRGFTESLMSDCRDVEGLEHIQCTTIHPGEINEPMYVLALTN